MTMEAAAAYARERAAKTADLLALQDEIIAQFGVRVRFPVLAAYRSHALRRVSDLPVAAPIARKATKDPIASPEPIGAMQDGSDQLRRSILKHHRPIMRALEAQGLTVVWA